VPLKDVVLQRSVARIDTKACLISLSCVNTSHVVYTVDEDEVQEQLCDRVDAFISLLGPVSDMQIQHSTNKP
jgi:hypothetical protein